MALTNSECSARYRYRHPDRVRAYQQKNKEKIKAYRKEWSKHNREKCAAASRRCRSRLREKVLLAYGNKCACCGETQIQFLALDHVNGGGNEERRQLNITDPIEMYRLVRNRGFPPEYQVLCHNCNMAKSLYGQCPHRATLT